MRLVLREQQHIARDTYRMVFEKPEGLSFEPGQSIRVFFADSDESRTFTILDAPGDPVLSFAFRNTRSSFKKRLLALSAGEEIEAEGPFGERFRLHADTEIPAVFIAGGIGITPFYSIRRHIEQSNALYQTLLLSVNRKPCDAAFHEELEAHANTRHRFASLFTRSYNEAGRRTPFDEAYVRSHIVSAEEAFFYVAGPPLMVAATVGILERIGVSPMRINTKKV